MKKNSQINIETYQLEKLKFWYWHINGHTVGYLAQMHTG